MKVSRRDFAKAGLGVASLAAIGAAGTWAEVERPAQKGDPVIGRDAAHYRPGHQSLRRR